MMELPELSLAPTQFTVDKSTNSSSSESGGNPSRKRKFFSDHLSNAESAVQTGVDLQVKDPLPLDWEQCLDLESGEMYYLNRKTLRKCWSWPKDQSIDLELNISTLSNRSKPRWMGKGVSSSNSGSTDTVEDSKPQWLSAGTNMVAVACLNCHLLVILSKASPSCPNCKYVHSLPTLQTPLPKAPAVKSLSTLSLLH